MSLKAVELPSDTRSRPALFVRVHAGRSAQGRAQEGERADDMKATQPRDYLYRGLLRCGICGLRMWGNHRRSSTYYSCQPSHQRSANIPADHPRSVYLNQARLDAALFGSLSAALFGADRLGYWTRCLEAAAGPERVAPAAERLREVQAELVDLEGRLTRQLLRLRAVTTAGNDSR